MFRMMKESFKYLLDKKKIDKENIIKSWYIGHNFYFFPEHHGGQFFLLYDIEELVESVQYQGSHVVYYSVLNFKSK